MNRILHIVLGTKARLAMALVMVGLAAGTSYADMDCSTITACVIRHGSTYTPAFGVYVTGPYHVEMDVFRGGTCANVPDDASAGDGNGTGQMWFEDFLDPQLASGDLVSLNIRAGSCPAVNCVTVTAGVDLCPGF